jgi:hypothetical protein
MPTTYAIPNGRTVFAPTIWTGVGTNSAITISNAVNGVSFKPDFVWEKPRSLAYTHSLSNSVVGTNIRLNTASTSAEETNFTYGYTSSFNSDGFTASSGSTSNENWNTTSATFVAWQWKASNATAVSNTSGTITSSVSANTAAGFSIVTFTTQSSGTATIGHGLGATPSMLILKVRNSANSWPTYHISIGLSAYATLNTSAITSSSANAFISTSSTTFGLGTDFANSSNYVAYCFAQIAGYSQFGSYVGNGSSDGPFIYTGFKPAFILTKNITTAGYWWEMVDIARSPYNPSNKTLYANVVDTEYTSSAYDKDLLSNGFKMRGNSAGQNSSGDTFIYMAFASNPFKYANAG